MTEEVAPVVEERYGTEILASMVSKISRIVRDSEKHSELGELGNMGTRIWTREPVLLLRVS